MKSAPRRKNIILTIMAVSWLLANIVLRPAAADDSPKTILAFGDSLTAGYGMSLDQSFPAQLEKKLAEERHSVKVINAGVTGETTSGGLTRLEWTLDQHKPDFVILELGANDMLRAVDPDVTFDNLQKMLNILRARKIPVLLAGMKATPNLGSRFMVAYPGMYKTLAKEYKAVYFPFFLDGVMLHPQYLLGDGLHPNPAGVAVIVENIYPLVEELLGID